MVKLHVDYLEQKAEINFDKPIVFIHSVYDELDAHSLSLKEYLNNAGIKTEIIPSDVKKEPVSESCNLSLDRVLFISAKANTDWMVNKYLEWLMAEVKDILRLNPEKKEVPFIVRCPLSVYSPEFKTILTTTYTGDILEVRKQIRKDFSVKIRKFEDKPGDDLPRVFKLY